MKLSAFAFLFLSSVAVSSAHADTDRLGGRWRGTYSSPLPDTVIELQFDQAAGLYRGRYWSARRSETDFPANEPGFGDTVRFAVPNVGVFEGRLHGDTIEGNFVSAEGTAAAHVSRAPEPDFGFVD